MKTHRIAPNDSRVQAAVAALQALIQHHYPTVTFAVTHGEDPEGTYVIATVDVEDTDEVIDVYIERLLEYQINAGLAVYVVPVRPLQRVTKALP
jgi:hypothetical protein